MSKCCTNFNWLIEKWNWPHATLFTGLFLFILFPLWVKISSLAAALVFLQLPIYMIHQWEEHDKDRFRLFFNGLFGNDALTPTATFWINFLGVWVVDLAALYGAVFFDPSYGLVAFYIPLLNSMGHILPAIGKKCYNPGLITAIAMFIPISGGSLYCLQTHLAFDWKPHAVGAGLAFAIHAAIIIHVRIRLARLGSKPEGQ